MDMVRTLHLWGLLAAIVMALASVPNSLAQVGTVQVRLIHAVPAVPAVDVFVNGERILTNVAFFSASDYLALAAGTYRLQLSPTGQPAAAALLETMVTLVAGTAYTLAATGLVATMQLTLIEDNLGSPAAGNVKLRFYHFVPDAPPVDVQLADGATIMSGLAFAEASGYLELPAGTYSFQITPAGEDAVVLDLPNLNLESGYIYSVFASNVVASLTPQLTITNPATTPAPIPAPALPARLPATSGTSLPMTLVVGVALALLGSALVLRRRAS